jgi:hypothetical protein
MKRLFKEETLAFLAVWLPLLFLGRDRLFRDPGTFWHVVVGQHILASHHLPHKDIFSFTSSGHPWIDSQWLIECLMAVINKILGFDGLLIISSAILALLFAWLFRRLMNAGLNFMLAGLTLALALGASAMHFHVRPHLVTIILMAFTFSWVCDFEAKRITRKQLLWLVPVFIFWANSHGGVLGGLGTLFLTITGWSLARLIHWESPLNNFREELFLWGLFLACGLATLVNPYGMELPRTWLAIMNSPVISARIQEHVPLLKSQGSVMVIAFGIFYLGALLGTLPRRPRITWLIPLVWFVLAWSRVRHAPLFAVTAVVALADILPRVRWAKWLAAHGFDTFRIKSGLSQGRKLSLTQLALPVLAVCSLLIFVGLPRHNGAPPGQGLVRLDPSHWPVGLLPELQDYAKSHKKGTRIFNDYLMGGFLIFYAPRLRVFIDDRCELYGDKFMLTVFDAPGCTIEDWSKQYGFDSALTETGSQYQTYLKSAPGWRLVKQTAAGSFYEKVSQ